MNPAVEAFLDGRIPFTRIAAVVEGTLAGGPAGPCGTLEDLLAQSDSEMYRRKLKKRQKRDE